MTVREAFLERLPRRSDFDECWVWTGALKPNGYGRFQHGGRTTQAHRWSYELFVGEIPEGAVIDHLCSNRGCCNPAHLEAVTQIVNIRRSKPDHCPNGHTYTDATTLRREYNGQRICLICTPNWGHKRYYGPRDVVCRNGHPRTIENTYVSGGRRRCKRCQQIGWLKPGGYGPRN